MTRWNRIGNQLYKMFVPTSVVSCIVGTLVQVGLILYFVFSVHTIAPTSYALGVIYMAWAVVLHRRKRRAVRYAGSGFQVNITGIPPAGAPVNIPAIAQKPPLPVRQQDEPFIGWKQAKIVVDSGKLVFEAFNGKKYGLEATAQCHQDNSFGISMAQLSFQLYTLSLMMGQKDAKPPEIPKPVEKHNAPHENCRCGYYAFKDKPEALEEPHMQSGDLGDAMLQVELFGKVIVAQKGYRAERMRVLSVEFSRKCARCTGPADGIHVGTDLRLRPGCSKCVPLGLATLAEMAGQLGTEVKWLNNAPQIEASDEAAA